MTGQRRQPGAEDEQEKERLDEGSDGPQTVPPEPDQLPLPNDLRRSEVVAQAVLGQGHPDLGHQLRLCFDGFRVPRELGRHLYRLPARQRCAIAPHGVVLDASASRIVLAGIGHEHVVQRWAGDTDGTDGEVHFRKQAGDKLLP